MYHRIIAMQGVKHNFRKQACWIRTVSKDAMKQVSLKLDIHVSSTES